MRLRELRGMIAAGTSDGFYDWPEWDKVRRDILAMDRWECQHCKARGRYRRAILVHHVRHLKDRPDLALSPIDPETGGRQLVSLCRACHEEQHPERRHGGALPPPPVTQERWD